jgi:hypothetical protein
LLWARSLLRERSHDRPADADPRRRFSPAVGALPAYAPTSDAPCVASRHRRVRSIRPDQLPPRACLATRAADSTQRPRTLGSAVPVREQRA